MKISRLASGAMDGVFLFFRCGVLVVVAIALGGRAPGDEVIPIAWPTRHAAPPPDVGAQANSFLPAFRVAVASLPEATVTTLALSQSGILGSSRKEVDMLLPLVAERYRLIAASPTYARAKSALPYCYLAERASQGYASLFVPDGATAASPVIVFIHGYGGSFLWYQHWLSEAFPHHIILCPAYGITTAQIAPEYVAEAMEASAKHLGFPLRRPSLLGLSNGGFGACRLFVQRPQAYAQLICLAAYPTDDTLTRFPVQVSARFLAGGSEPFVSSGDLLRRVQVIRKQAPSTDIKLIDGADHFFILTHPKQTMNVLEKWVNSSPR